jgi:hypothetical protein
MNDAVTTESASSAEPARDLLGDAAPAAKPVEVEADFETSCAIRYACLGIEVFQGKEGRRPRLVLDAFGAGRKSAPMELDLLQTNALIAALQRARDEMGSRQRSILSTLIGETTRRALASGGVLPAPSPDSAVRVAITGERGTEAVLPLAR